jgi:small-conductance mechanosensitive channel
MPMPTFRQRLPLRLLLLALLGLLVSLAGVVATTGIAFAGPNDGLPKTTAALDRATPRRAMTGFLDATRHGNFVIAAHYLDLRAAPAAAHARVGPALAEQLSYVIERKMPIELSKINDESDGGLTAGATAVAAGTIYLADEEIPIQLVRVKFDDGVSRWVISRGTLSMVPALHKAYGEEGWIEERLPDVLTRVTFNGNEAWQWLGMVLLAIMAYLAGRTAAWVLVGIGRRIAKRTMTPSDDLLVAAARRPLRYFLAAFLYDSLDTYLHLTVTVDAALRHVTYTLIVVSLTWFVIRAIGVGTAWAQEGMPNESKYEVKDRIYRTQLALLRRIAAVIVVVVAIAIVLVQFEFVRNVGLSLLASAGLAGIVFGLAAQKSLAGVVAGIQLSITQPIRIGDMVKVEGEVGHIEELNLTYVVLRTWDQRRFVVPIGRFLDQSFENWTMTNPELLGVVLLPVDFMTPVELVRKELTRICEGHPAWDRRKCALQVTDVTDRSMVLRGVVSAATAPQLWDLRCDAREKLLAFLRALEGGRYLSVQRLAYAPGPLLDGSGLAGTAGGSGTMTGDSGA